MGWTKFPFYELGQQERGQGCIRYKCAGGGLTNDDTNEKHALKGATKNILLQTYRKI